MQLYRDLMLMTVRPEVSYGILQNLEIESIQFEMLLLRGRWFLRNKVIDVHKCLWIISVYEVDN